MSEDRTHRAILEILAVLDRLDARIDYLKSRVDGEESKCGKFPEEEEIDKIRKMFVGVE